MGSYNPLSLVRSISQVVILANICILVKKEEVRDHLVLLVVVGEGAISNLSLFSTEGRKHYNVLILMIIFFDRFF